MSKIVSINLYDIESDQSSEEEDENATKVTQPLITSLFKTKSPAAAQQNSTSQATTPKSSTLTRSPKVFDPEKLSPSSRDSGEVVQVVKRSQNVKTSPKTAVTEKSPALPKTLNKSDAGSKTQEELEVTVKNEAIEVEEPPVVQQSWQDLDSSVFVKQEDEIVVPMENLDNEDILDEAVEALDDVEDHSVLDTTKLGILDEQFGFFYKGAEDSHLKVTEEPENPPKRLKLSEVLQDQVTPKAQALKKRQVACKSTSKVSPAKLEATTPQSKTVVQQARPQTSGLIKIGKKFVKITDITSKNGENSIQMGNKLIKIVENSSRIEENLNNLSGISTNMAASLKSLANADKTGLVKFVINHPKNQEFMKSREKRKFKVAPRVAVQNYSIMNKKSLKLAENLSKNRNSSILSGTKEDFGENSWKFSENSTSLRENSTKLSENSEEFEVREDKIEVKEEKMDDFEGGLDDYCKNDENFEENLLENEDFEENFRKNRENFEKTYNSLLSSTKSDPPTDINIKDEPMDDDFPPITPFNPSFTIQSANETFELKEIKEEELTDYYAAGPSTSSDTLVSTKIVTLPPTKPRKIIVIKKPYPAGVTPGAKIQRITKAQLEQLEGNPMIKKVIHSNSGSRVVASNGHGSIKYIVKSPSVQIGVKLENSPQSALKIANIASATKSTTVNFPKTNTKIVVDKSNTVYRCQRCHLLFTNHAEYTEHLQEHSTTKTVAYSEKVVNLEELQKMNQYQCSQCTAGFPTLEKLSSHENRHKTEFLCKYCGKKFLLLYRYKEHMMQHEAARAKYMECKVCGKKFLKQERFDEHMAIHIPSEVLTCNICDKKFPNQAQLVEHQRMVHVRKTAFKCGLCQYETFVKQNFEKHASMHMRYVEKMTTSTFFKCDMCPQSFRERSALDMHKGHMHS